MNRQWLWISIAILLGGYGFVAGASSFYINGSAATVGKKWITLEDVRFYLAVQRYLADEKEIVSPTDADTLKKALRKLIFEEMLLEEMSSLHVAGSGAGEPERKIKARRSKDRSGSWEKLLRRFHRTEAQVVERVRREIDARKFLERKVETLSPQITSADIDRQQRLNPQKFSGPAGRSEALAELKRKKTEDGLEEWIRFLRDKYGVANYFEG